MFLLLMLQIRASPTLADQYLLTKSRQLFSSSYRFYPGDHLDWEKKAIVFCW